MPWNSAKKKKGSDLACGKNRNSRLISVSFKPTPTFTTHMIMICQLSGPALKLLSQSGLAASQVDEALTALVRDRAQTVLRYHHPLVRRLKDATGINVVQIARRSKYLLIEIEQHDDQGPLWQYREHAPRRCIFSCRGQIPATIEAALQGELLERLVNPAVMLQGAIVQDIAGTADGWLNIHITPQWQSF